MTESRHRLRKELMTQCVSPETRRRGGTAGYALAAVRRPEWPSLGGPGGGRKLLPRPHELARASWRVRGPRQLDPGRERLEGARGEVVVWSPREWALQKGCCSALLHRSEEAADGESHHG